MTPVALFPPSVPALCPRPLFCSAPCLGCARFIHTRQWGACVGDKGWNDHLLITQQLRCSRGHKAVPAVRLNPNSSLEARQYWGGRQHESTPALFNSIKGTTKQSMALRRALLNTNGECPAASPFCIPTLNGGQHCHDGKAYAATSTSFGTVYRRISQLRRTLHALCAVFGLAPRLTGG